MRSTVADAIRAGEILAKIKSQLSHGNFIPWIKANCNFSERTAYNYIGLHSHSSKIATVANLQEAYKQVETLEAQAHMSEKKKADLRVNSFLKTGEKPEGWRRGTDDKLADEEKKYRERMSKMQADMEREHQARVDKQPPPFDFGDIGKLVAEQTNLIKKRIDFKERIRISHEGKNDPFIDAIMDYLETLSDDNRRIEACYNIIKVCKGIANQLQGKG
jgi:hypothetical protein